MIVKGYKLIRDGDDRNTLNIKLALSSDPWRKDRKKDILFNMGTVWLGLLIGS